MKGAEYKRNSIWFRFNMLTSSCCLSWKVGWVGFWPQHFATSVIQENSVHIHITYEFMSKLTCSHVRWRKRLPLWRVSGLSPKHFPQEAPPEEVGEGAPPLQARPKPPQQTVNRFTRQSRVGHPFGSTLASSALTHPGVGGQEWVWSTRRRSIRWDDIWLCDEGVVTFVVDPWVNEPAVHSPRAVSCTRQ